MSPIDRLLCWLRGSNRQSWRFRLFDTLDAPFWIGWPPYVRCRSCGRILDCGDPCEEAYCLSVRCAPLPEC